MQNCPRSPIFLISAFSPRNFLLVIVKCIFVHCCFRDKRDIEVIQASRLVEFCLLIFDSIKYLTVLSWLTLERYSPANTQSLCRHIQTCWKTLNMSIYYSRRLQKLGISLINLISMLATVVDKYFSASKLDSSLILQ